MPFSFIHPIYLYALITASVPLLIHLLNRRRLKRVPFPAVRFILLSQRRISRSYRLRHWLLLVLRTFAVLLLVLLLAHPLFQTGAGLSAGGGPLSMVVLLDDSLSLTWSRRGKGFEEAKGAARLLISSLREGDRAALIPTSTSATDRVRFKNERDALLRDLDAIRITAGTADFSTALRRAHELLKEPAAQKGIWLITDMALTGWDRFTLSSLGHYDPLIPLKLIDLGKNEELLNATVKEVKIPGPGVSVGRPIDLEALINNFSNREIEDVLVQLTLNDREREQRLIALPPLGETGVRFQFKLGEPGDHHGYVGIKKAGIAGNSKVHFTLHAQERIKILIVDGDPKTSLIRSETYFLARALDPAGGLDSSLFLPRVVIPEALRTLTLEDYQVLVFCNVPLIPDAVLPRLRAYLRGGGGLLLFLGDRVRAGDYNRQLFQTGPPILPARIGEKTVFPQTEGVTVKEFDGQPLALKGVSDQVLKTSLQSVRVHGYFRADGPSQSPLLSLANGDPLLMERKVGSGRVLLLTTAADQEWSDLPFKTAYLPLVQSLAIYLSGDKTGVADRGIVAGSAKTLSFPPSYVGKTVRITKPDLKEREITLAADGERASVSFTENDLSGIYRVSSAASGFGQGSDGLPVPPLYAVNPPFLESRLKEVSPGELRALLRPMEPEIIPLDLLKRGGTNMDLALPVLLLLIVTLALEGWLGQRTYE